ncbi:sulfite exporter TauE/SafE family protein [Paenibacillus sp. CECT 9249]|uniref:sulfite exporter TauE/SafE family protein n=1 Tax=Paenibacillus sp. CECT 9249 TaxID=2845385 RepID=UPI001E5C44EF|nr:sulfite exporter TauE/SafE family protein [Paenibacillus sp. CECT 9249]
MIMAAMSGLAGAPHCFIMCGGIVASYALSSGSSSLQTALAYNMGRVLTYGAIGCFMGAVGSFVNAAGLFVGIQGFSSMLGGVFILLWAFRKYSLPFSRIRLPGMSRAQTFIGRLRERYELPAVFLTGLTLGFLPCGLTYAMQMKAAAAGSWTDGGLIMLIFGLSTFPVLVFTALSAGSIRKKWRKSLNKAGIILAFAMGTLSVMKGLSANGWIPAVHPWLW